MLHFYLVISALLGVFCGFMYAKIFVKSLKSFVSASMPQMIMRSSLRLLALGILLVLLFLQLKCAMLVFLGAFIVSFWLCIIKT